MKVTATRNLAPRALPEWTRDLRQPIATADAEESVICHRAMPYRPSYWARLPKGEGKATICAWNKQYATMSEVEE